MKQCKPHSLVFSAVLVSASPFLSGINRLEKKNGYAESSVLFGRFCKTNTGLISM